MDDPDPALARSEAIRGRSRAQEPLSRPSRDDNGGALYDDGNIACDDTSLIIRRYYPWGAKTIPYTAIKSIDHLSPLGVRRWRLWGSGDFVHWWNRDGGRPKKKLALVINTGHRVRPTITPDDPATVERILTEHMRPAHE